MKRPQYLTIFIVGLLVRILVGLMQNSPGFMDAEYYFIGGLNLVQGNGFSENILWHYLDDPSGLPHPSHGYWMPLASILAAFSMFLAQSYTFRAAQLVFILISSLLPPLTAYLCFLLTQDRASSILAGGLAILSGFYLPFMTTTETFGIYAVLGALFFILLSEPYASRQFFKPLAIGAIAGLMHLSRTDGFLWLGFAGISIFMSSKIKFPSHKKNFWGCFQSSYLIIFGYLMAMGPWFIRNFIVFGSPLAPGSSRTLWIIDYNEMFTYPANLLTLERWLASGWATILKARGWALTINLGRSTVEQGMVFLAPLILIGLWQFRKEKQVQVGILAWVSTYFLMTLVFPYQGARGGLFHSNAALLALWWSAATIGFSTVLEWAQRHRNWDIREARNVFTVALLCFAIAITIYSGWTKFSREGQEPSEWEKNQMIYQQVESAFLEFGADPQEIILTINPPGYYYVSSRPTIGIPNGDIQTTLEVAQRFEARYLVLEEDHPKGLSDLYENPEMSIEGLQYMRSVNNTHLFVINRQTGDG
jgi:hypothetical protein